MGKLEGALSKSLSRNAGGWQVMAGAHDCCALGSPLGRTEGGPARLPWGSEGERVCPRAGVCVQTASEESTFKTAVRLSSLER